MKNKIVIKNNLGTSVGFEKIGAAIFDIILTLKNGKTRNIVMRPTNQDESSFSKGYYGKTIGRNAGRIKDGKFSINNTLFTIEEKLPNHGLHGGNNGLAFKKFSYFKKQTKKFSRVHFTYISPHLEGGFPGEVKIIITYSLALNENKLSIDFKAKSALDTLLNLTNHTYFNLNGHGLILDHSLMIDANCYSEVNKNLLPTKIANVTKVMDFREEKLINRDIEDATLQLITHGYDHPYLLRVPSLIKPCAVVKSTNKEVILKIYTTYPIIVFYSGNKPSYGPSNISNKMRKYQGMALETQYLPNAINNPLGQTKTGLLRAGSVYQETTIYEFITK